MERIISFKVPDSSVIMVGLVEAVPSTWKSMSGHLFAPETLIRSGQAVNGTGFRIDCFGNTTVVNEFNNRPPDILAIVGNNKLPGFVVFSELERVGRVPDWITLEAVKKIAVALLKDGYRGDLRFFRNYEHDLNKNSARCKMVFEPVGRRVELEWVPEL